MLPKPQSKGDFLKAQHLAPLLNKQGKAPAKIADEPSVGKYGIDVPLSIGSQPFVLTLNENGRDYKTVFDALGANSDDWVGASLTLGLREGTNKDGDRTDYVCVLGVKG